MVVLSHSSCGRCSHESGRAVGELICAKMLSERDGIVGSGIQQILKIQQLLAAKLCITLLRLKFYWLFCQNSLDCFPEPTLIVP